MSIRLHFDFSDDERRRAIERAIERSVSNFLKENPVPPVPPGALRASMGLFRRIPPGPVKPFDSVAEADAFGDEVAAWLRKQGTP